MVSHEHVWWTEVGLDLHLDRALHQTSSAATAGVREHPKFCLSSGIAVGAGLRDDTGGFCHLQPS
jgi:hypothetical protein